MSQDWYATRVHTDDGVGFVETWSEEYKGKVRPSLDTEVMERTERPGEYMALVELRTAEGYAMVGMTSTNMREVASQMLATANRLDEMNEVRPRFIYTEDEA